jgi:hypothetical protein
VWADDLAIYVDGKCMGRYPAHIVSGERDIDYPLALVAYGPVDVTNCKVAQITAFSDKPVVAQAAEQPSNTRENARGSRRGRRSRDKEP